METKIILNGVVKLSDDRELFIGGEPVAATLEECPLNGKPIHMRFTWSNEPIDPSTIEEQSYLAQFDKLEANHRAIPFSEWTGFVAWDDTLKVGGHDLHEELELIVGLYCYLEIYSSSSSRGQ